MIESADFVSLAVKGLYLSLVLSMPMVAAAAIVGTLMGVLLLQLYLVLFLMHGGANAVLETYYASYAVWPLAATWPSLDAGFAAHWLRLFDTMVRLSVMLAAPAMIAMLLAEIGLAIVSMFAPQLPVFFLAMPVKACIALFVLVLYLATLMGYLGDHAAAMSVILPDLGRLVR